MRGEVVGRDVLANHLDRVGEGPTDSVWRTDANPAWVDERESVKCEDCVIGEVSVGPTFGVGASWSTRLPTFWPDPDRALPPLA